MCAPPLQVPADSLAEAHRHPPPLALWQKVAPLALIFFGASFNLTILQAGRRCAAAEVEHSMRSMADQVGFALACLPRKRQRRAACAPALFLRCLCAGWRPVAEPCSQPLLRPPSLSRSLGNRR